MLLQQHQKNAVKFILNNDEAALFMCPRSGKTVVSLSAFNEEEKKIDDYCGIVICLKANKELSWVKLSNILLPHWGIFTDWEDFKAHQGPKLFIVHYEMFRNKKLLGRLLRYSWDRITVDESQHIKNRSSANARAVHRFRAKVDRKLILTGEPIDGDVMDLWSQFKFIDSSLLNDRWALFVDRYLRKTGYMGYKLVVRDGCQKKILKKIKKKCFVIEELPNLMMPEFIDYPVELTGQARRMYEEMDRTLITKIGGELITAPFAGVKAFKLHQITGGTILDENKVPHRIGGSKFDHAIRLIDTLDKPLIIFCRFREELKRFEEALGEYRVRTIQGKNKNRREKDISKFQRGVIDILLAQIGSGGTGLDLFKGDVALLYSYGHSLIQFRQAMARMSLLDKKRRPRVVRIFANNTVDTDLMYVIEEKSSTSKNTLITLRGRYGKR